MALTETLPTDLQKADHEAGLRMRLQDAFDRARNPMLIVDDDRRCVTANAPACGLLGIEPDEVAWSRIDDFAAAEDRATLDKQWRAFLDHGAVEGWYHLPLPTGRVLPVEFSATANVLPGRHLSVVMPRPRPTFPADAQSDVAAVRGRIVMTRREADWARVVRDAGGLLLTEREREVLGHVARGLRGCEIAKDLFLSPETIKSHVQNAMAKLGAHTRAHAVALALMTGQIDTLSVSREQLEPAGANTTLAETGRA